MWAFIRSPIWGSREIKTWFYHASIRRDFNHVRTGFVHIPFVAADAGSSGRGRLHGMTGAPERLATHPRHLTSARTAASEAARHNRTASSLLVVAMIVPSGEKVTPVLRFVPPFRVNVVSAVATSQSITVRS